MENCSLLPIRQDMPPLLQWERKYGKNGQNVYFCKNWLKKLGNQENRCSSLTYVAKDDQIRVNLVLLLFGGRTEWFLSLFMLKTNKQTIGPQELWEDFKSPWRGLAWRQSWRWTRARSPVNMTVYCLNVKQFSSVNAFTLLRQLSFFFPLDHRDDNALWLIYRVIK